jgi:hypothetical protein
MLSLWRAPANCRRRLERQQQGVFPGAEHAGANEQLVQLKGLRAKPRLAIQTTTGIDSGRP